MSAEESKEVARRFIYDVWQRGDRGVSDEIIAHDIVIHDGTFAGQPPGPEGQVYASEFARGAFPDMQWTIDLLVAEGGVFVDRWTMRGTFLGPLGSTAPTGRPATWTEVDILRIDNGKVVELWHAENSVKS